MSIHVRQLLAANDLKPDLVAPGERIQSPVPGGYADAARLLLDAGADVNADAGSGPPEASTAPRLYARVPTASQ